MRPLDELARELSLKKAKSDRLLQEYLGEVNDLRGEAKKALHAHAYERYAGLMDLANETDVLARECEAYSKGLQEAINAIVRREMKDNARNL